MKTSILLVSFLISLLSLFCAVQADTTDFIVPPSSQASALYPAWAHAHWVWLSSPEAFQESETNLVKDYLNYGIPVGAVDVDSMWSNCANDFVINTKKYPNMKEMISGMHSLNVRVIYWATSVVDNNCASFAEGVKNGYFLRGIDGKNTIKWWHGVGSFIDYTNPAALQWWHSQLDTLLSIGADGWKCDGTDPYLYEMIAALNYKDRIITKTEYSNSYYGDFFNYSRSINPDALIMSRPVDSYKDLYLTFSPRYAVFSGWVGDQDPSFSGLQDALRNMFHSAWKKYVGFGSDIGGYKYGPAGPYGLGRTQELFIRWSQVGSFCSLMENGGEGEHRPWIFDEKMGLKNNQTLNIYRTFVFIHQSLQSYLLSAGADAWENNHSIMNPVAHETIFTPSSWDYFLGKDIFVAPIVTEASQAATRVVNFPKGNNWVNWWNTSVVYAGGSSVNWDATNLATFPVFHRQGSILPVEDVVVGSDHHTLSDALTFLIHHPTTTATATATTVRRYRAASQEIAYTFDAREQHMQITATAHSRKMAFRIIGIAAAPIAVKTRFSASTDLVESTQLNIDPDYIYDPARAANNNPFPVSTGLQFLHVPSTSAATATATAVSWFYDAKNQELEILIPDASRGLLLEISGLKTVLSA